MDQVKEEKNSGIQAAEMKPASELSAACGHARVEHYVTAGRFAPPADYWSCVECGADFAPTSKGKGSA